MANQNLIAITTYKLKLRIDQDLLSRVLCSQYIKSKFFFLKVGGGVLCYFHYDCCFVFTPLVEQI